MEAVVEKVATAHNISKKAAKELVHGVLDAIQSEVAAGNKVAFLGFGTFEKVHKKERESFNPATKTKVKYPATDVPKFKAGSKFKAAVKGA